MVTTWSGEKWSSCQTINSILLALCTLLNESPVANQVKPDDSQSSFQTSGKFGWCYIGEDQGIRACAEVGVNDMCMSGNIFPSQEICMNPNLRA